MKLKRTPISHKTTHREGETMTYPIGKPLVRPEPRGGRDQRRKYEEDVRDEEEDDDGVVRMERRVPAVRFREVGAGTTEEE